MKYLITLFFSIVVTLEIVSCKDVVVQNSKEPTLDSLSLRLDSIGFEPFVKSLIGNKSLINFEIIGSFKGEMSKFLKDSLYKSMQQSKWFLYGVDWFSGNESYTFYSKCDNDSTIQNYIINHVPDYSSHKFTIPASQNKVFQKVIDSIKLSVPIYNYHEEVMVCGGIDMLIFDGSKFYYLSGSYGQPTKQMLQILGPIYSRYFKRTR